MSLYGPDDRPLPPAELRDPLFDPRVQSSGFSPGEARHPTAGYMDAARLEVERAFARLDASGVQDLSLENFARELAGHTDGFSNDVTGLGNPAFDKTLGGRIGGPGFRLVRRTYQECSDIARGSDLGRNIVDKPADEMTREGWDVEVQPTEEDVAPEQDPAVKLDAARRSPRRAAAGWRKDAKRCAVQGDRIGEARGRNFARRWDAVAMGMDPPEAAPPPPRGPLPKINDEGIELSEAIDEWAEAIDVVGNINQGLRYERGFGGGAVFIGVDDGVSDLTQPLDPSKVKAVTHLTPLAGGLFGEVVMWRPYNDARKPKFGLPEIFQVRNQYVQLARPPAPGETRPVQQNVPIPIWYVHESRMLVFDGEPMSRQARQEMGGWGDSIFTRVAEPLAQYEQTWNAVAVLMQEFSVATLSITGLANALAKQGATNARRDFLEKAWFTAMTQSVARMRFVDATEKFDRSTASVAGVAEILREYSLRLAAAVDMPVSLLFGQVQGGLGNTGNTDLRWFYDRIRSKQLRRLLPQLQYLYRLGWLAKDSPTRGVEPDRWAITFRPLWQMTDLEQADLRLKTQQADSGEIASQVVTPEEVAVTRYGGAEYNPGPIVLDRESRGGAAAYDMSLAAKVAQQSAADPYAAPGVQVASATPGYGSASVPIPPMTAMPSSPITGDPQSTPSNIGLEPAPAAPAPDEEEAAPTPVKPAPKRPAAPPPPPVRPAPAPAPARAAPVAPPTVPLELTSTAQGAIVKVNEARASLGLPKLTTATGSVDPDGELTIAEYTAKRQKTIAAGVEAEAGKLPAEQAASVKGPPQTPTRADADQPRVPAGQPGGGEFVSSSGGGGSGGEVDDAGDDDEGPESHEAKKERVESAGQQWADDVAAEVDWTGLGKTWEEAKSAARLKRRTDDEPGLEDHEVEDHARQSWLRAREDYDREEAEVRGAKPAEDSGRTWADTFLDQEDGDGGRADPEEIASTPWKEVVENNGAADRPKVEVAHIAAQEAAAKSRWEYIRKVARVVDKESGRVKEEADRHVDKMIEEHGIEDVRTMPDNIRRQIEGHFSKLVEESNLRLKKAVKGVKEKHPDNEAASGPVVHKFYRPSIIDLMEDYAGGAANLDGRHRPARE